MSTLATDAPLAVAVTEAIQTGDLAALRRVLREHPDLAAAHLGDEGEARTLLHVSTDWHGHFPNGPAVVAALVEAGTDPPAPDEVTDAFWQACHGGQRQTAEYLRDRGADLNWVGWNDRTPLDIAEAQGAGEVVEWLRSQGGRSAAELR